MGADQTFNHEGHEGRAKIAVIARDRVIWQKQELTADRRG
jgi:hypothetical protein